MRREKRQLPALCVQETHRRALRQLCASSILDDKDEPPQLRAGVTFKKQASVDATSMQDRWVTKTRTSDKIHFCKAIQDGHKILAPENIMLIFLADEPTAVLMEVVVFGMVHAHFLNEAIKTTVSFNNGMGGVVTTTKTELDFPWNIIGKNATYLEGIQDQMVATIQQQPQKGPVTDEMAWNEIDAMHADTINLGQPWMRYFKDVQNSQFVMTKQDTAVTGPDRQRHMKSDAAMRVTLQRIVQSVVELHRDFCIASLDCDNTFVKEVSHSPFPELDEFVPGYNFARSVIVLKRDGRGNWELLTTEQLLNQRDEDLVLCTSLSPHRQHAPYKDGVVSHVHPPSLKRLRPLWLLKHFSPTREGYKLKTRHKGTPLAVQQIANNEQTWKETTTKDAKLIMYDMFRADLLTQMVHCYNTLPMLAGTFPAPQHEEWWQQMAAAGDLATLCGLYQNPPSV